MLPVTGISMLLVIAFTFLLEEGPPRAYALPSDGIWRLLRQDMGLVVFFVSSFLIGAAIYMSVMFDGIYMTSLGGTQGMVGFMFGLTAFSEPPTMHYSQALIRRLGGPRSLLLAYGVLLVAFVGYSFAWQPWMLLVTSAVKGLGFGLFWTGTIQQISIRAPEHLASTAQSLLNTSTFGVAPVVVSLLSGELFDIFGPRSVFIAAVVSVAGAILVLSTALLRGVFREKSSEVVE
jgi:MFS family permease